MAAMAMNLKLLLLMGILSSGLFVLAWQKVSPPEVFTASQAEAGRTAYERTCAKCHVSDLRGRPGRGRDGRGPLGEQSKLPPISSLSPGYQQFIGKRGFVPPLTGEAFISRWGDKTAGELVARFDETVTDPFFQFEDVKDDTTVNITAYVLQVNGAKAGAQPLTRTTAANVSETVKR